MIVELIVLGLLAAYSTLMFWHMTQTHKRQMKSWDEHFQRTRDQLLKQLILRAEIDALLKDLNKKRDPSSE